MNHSGNNIKPSGDHFWEPWGRGGCLVRSIIFLLGLLLFAFLFSLFLKTEENIFENQAFETPDPYEEARDTSIVNDWNDSIPNVKELPTPDENYIPSLDSTRIATNPEDSLSLIVDNQIIILFNSQNLKADMISFAQQFKTAYPNNTHQISYYNPTAGTMLLIVPSEELISIINELPQKIPNIDYIATVNEILAELGKPSDPDFSDPKFDEYFKLIQAYEAWDITRGSRDVKVAIIDSYFDITHPELKGRYVDAIHIPSKTRDVLPPRQVPSSMDDLGLYCHGSHVAGIAVGAQNNQMGCSGIAPECSWIPIALGDQMTSFNELEGILYAVYHGADVVNMSIGKQFPEGIENTPIAQQADYAKNYNKRGEALWEYVLKVANDHKCIVCFAAGNDNIIMGMDAKKRSQNAINVEAVDNHGLKCDFSDFGDLPQYQIHFSTVSAPGDCLWSVTDKRCVPIWKQLEKKTNFRSSANGFQEMSGTSMASPVVAGAVALLKSKNKNLTCEEAIKILTLTGKQVDKTNHIGPLIQLRDALDHTSTGNALNFDDLMKNHDLLIGKWKSTHELLILNNNKEVTAHIWEYITFANTTDGLLEMERVEDGVIYTAKMQVQWGKNAVNFIQLDDAKAPDGKSVHKDEYVCRPNSNRLLEVSIQENGVERFTFLLEKVE